jgi:hypothetical protein
MVRYHALQHLCAEIEEGALGIGHCTPRGVASSWVLHFRRRKEPDLGGGESDFEVPNVLRYLYPSAAPL